MTYRHKVADMGLRGVLRAIVEGMDNHAILNVGVVADGDSIDIATQHSIIPNRAVLANLHITNYSGILSQPSLIANLWLKATNFSNQSHICKILITYFPNSLASFQ